MSPDAKVWMYLVYFKYWTLNLIPLMVYPKVIFRPMFSIKADVSNAQVIINSTYRDCVTHSMLYRLCHSLTVSF